MARRSTPGVIAAGLVAVAIPLLMSCTTGGGDHTTTPARPVNTASAALPTSPAPTSAGVTRLSCGQQLRPTTPAPKRDPHVLGLSSDGWEGSPSPVPARHRSGERFPLQIKTYTYVTHAAAPRTTLHVLAPADAFLYYTDGATWNTAPSDRQIIEGATKFVSLQNCDSDLTGYPGMLLLSRPACVTVEVIAHQINGDKRQPVKIPMGKHC